MMQQSILSLRIDSNVRYRVVICRIRQNNFLIIKSFSWTLKESFEIKKSWNLLMWKKIFFLTLKIKLVHMVRTAVVGQG